MSLTYTVIVVLDLNHEVQKNYEGKFEIIIHFFSRFIPIER